MDDLDVNPRFLNVENSTVDLNTGELLPHPKEDIITKLAKVRYDRERCVQVPGVSVRIRELFKAYQEWCGENNEPAVSERFLGLRLKEMGFERTRTADARYWSSLALKP